MPKPRTHLDLSIPGNKPIFACVAGKEIYFPKKHVSASFRDAIELEEHRIEEKIDNAYSSGALNVDYDGQPSYLREEKFLNAGYQTYTISPSDSNDKFSEDLFDCTGMIVVGIDKDTGEQISFASHQDPKKILGQVRGQFIKDLRLRLEEMQARCLPGSIDAVIVGGIYRKYLPSYPKTVAGNQYRIDYQQNYLDSIQLLSEETRSILGFEPTVIDGPKTHYGDNYLFENKTRQLYFSRPYVNHRAADFPPSDVHKIKNRFRPKP